MTWLTATLFVAVAGGIWLGTVALITKTIREMHAEEHRAGKKPEQTQAEETARQNENHTEMLESIVEIVIKLEQTQAEEIAKQNKNNAEMLESIFTVINLLE